MFNITKHDILKKWREWLFKWTVLEPGDCQEQTLDHKQPNKKETQAYNEVWQTRGRRERLLIIYTRLQEDYKILSRTNSTTLTQK